MPSHLVVKPRDLTRLLGHFQSSLQEITFIATEPLSTPIGSEPTEAKALEMRSYIDPAKENTDDALHTQLWIDPAEELQEYSHSGSASDVTFNVKELKAFASFCEGSEADMHMYFKKAGYPVLLAPRFGLDDTAHADFDATLVLATCQASQIQGTDSFDQETAASGHAVEHNRQTSQDQDNSRGVSQRNLGSRSSTLRSDHTVIWSELSGSAERTRSERTTPVQAGRREPGQLPNSLDASEEIAFHLHMQHNNPASTPIAHSAEAVPMDVDIGIQGRQTPVQELRRVPDLPEMTPQQQAAAEFWPPTKGERPALARNLSNWVSGDVDDDEDDDTVGEDYCVPSTPPDRRGLY